jgi:prevent-host-death family protein
MRVLPLSEVKIKRTEFLDVVERRDESITITRRGEVS